MFLPEDLYIRQQLKQLAEQQEKEKQPKSKKERMRRVNKQSSKNLQEAKDLNIRSYVSDSIQGRNSGKDAGRDFGEHLFEYVRGQYADYFGEGDDVTDKLTQRFLQGAVNALQRYMD